MTDQGPLGSEEAARQLGRVAGPHAAGATTRMSSDVAKQATRPIRNREAPITSRS
jgi:hypothetical protein